MQDQENDRNPNDISNQDMREFKTAEKGIKDSGGSVEADNQPDENESDDSRSGNQS